MFSVTKSEIRPTAVVEPRTCFSVLLCSAAEPPLLCIHHLSLSLPLIFVFPRFSAAKRFTEFECQIRRLGKRLQNGFQSSMATQSALSLSNAITHTCSLTLSISHTHADTHTRTHTCRLIEAGGQFVAAAMGSEQRTYLKFLGPNLKRAKDERNHRLFGSEFCLFDYCYCRIHRPD